MAQQLLGFNRFGTFLAKPRRIFATSWLLPQSQFNRRVRALAWVPELIQALHQLGAFLERYWDTTPVPVMKLCRFGRTSLLGEASVGYCPSKKEYSVGFQVALRANWNGVIPHFDLIPAHIREAVERGLEASWNLVVLGDKGFIGQQWQADWQERRAHLILTPKRRNQKLQNPTVLDRLLVRPPGGSWRGGWTS